VGSEALPSWDSDALKAQAVAARSYALSFRYNPVSQSWYDLGADTRYQAYNGMDHEFTSTTGAVEGTRGQILVQDSQVIEAQYASTQELTDEAHHGIGMSQWGAADMAAKGHTYLDILGRYYPDATLASVR